jgi:hypothetical protein
MLAHETVLRQRYSLSFLTTTLLIALTTQSSLAFSLTPVAVGDWVPRQDYSLPNRNLKGFTTLNPLTVKSLPKGGTEKFLEKLKMEFPMWIFKSADNDLAGSFEVGKNFAIGSSTEVGGALWLQYFPGAGDPTPEGNTLHWIQRITNNHSKKTERHGDNADQIDITPEDQAPYFDLSHVSTEESFVDRSSRRDPDQNHTWSAELYLVEETAPKTVTIYNGVQWGWKNEVVPEPLTIFGSGIGLGLGVLFKKYSRKQEKAKDLEKLKS